MQKPEHSPLRTYREYPIDEMSHRATAFYREMKRRRTVRDFSNRPVPRSIVEDCLRTAGTSPSGANMQPWHFLVVTDPAIKHEIREAAQQQERQLYEERAPEEWLEALAPLGTGVDKPFLEEAAYLIIVFAQRFGRTRDGQKFKHYYVQESVGIAVGLLLAAIHNAGLVGVTYTPSPMEFLNELLGRPRSERPFLLLAVGYPSTDAAVPDLPKKGLHDFCTFV